MKVFVYFNLHKKLWSVKALQGPMKGRVIKHTNEIKLVDCEFKVSEAGRQRVIREQRKNVHAGVVGTMFEHEIPCSLPVSYNPYRFDKFFNKNTLEPVLRSPAVTMVGRLVQCN